MFHKMTRRLFCILLPMFFIGNVLGANCGGDGSQPWDIPENYQGTVTFEAYGCTTDLASPLKVTVSAKDVSVKPFNPAYCTKQADGEVQCNGSVKSVACTTSISLKGTNATVTCECPKNSVPVVTLSFIPKFYGQVSPSCSPK